MKQEALKNPKGPEPRQTIKLTTNFDSHAVIKAPLLKFENPKQTNP